VAQDLQQVSGLPLMSVVGQLSSCWREWQVIRASGQVLEWIWWGLPLELVAVPNEDGCQFPFTEDQLAWLHLELAWLVVIGTVQFMGCSARPEGIWLISPVFLVPKKGLKLWWLVINQQQLNLAVPSVWCKFKSMGTLARLVGHNWWGITFNLAQGYHHVTMHLEVCAWMGFHVGEDFYCYKVLPFGLKWSLWVFMKIVCVMVCFWWTQGILMFSYINNFCVVASTQDELLHIHNTVITLTLE
jgi:hypothetical protein